jgi:hypothetical protein
MMDQYIIQWGNKSQGVTREQYLQFQAQYTLLDSDEPQDFDSTTAGGSVYKGIVVRNVQFDDLPTVEAMDPIPPYANPFHHDQFNMGCDVSGPWMAMFREHAGHKQPHNFTEEDKLSSLPVFNPDPQYVIFVNQRTGQRFRLVFPSVVNRWEEQMTRLRIEACDED